MRLSATRWYAHYMSTQTYTCALKTLNTLNAFNAFIHSPTNTYHCHDHYNVHVSTTFRASNPLALDCLSSDIVQGGCQVTPRGYAIMTHMLTALAGGKVVIALEVRVSICTFLSSTYVRDAAPVSRLLILPLRAEFRVATTSPRFPSPWLRACQLFLVTHSRMTISTR